MTMKDFTRVLDQAAAAVPRSAAGCRQTNFSGWRPRPFGMRRNDRGSRPGADLDELLFKVVIDQSLIGSGVANVRRKLPEIVGQCMKLETDGVRGERAT